ncbi:zinc finger CCCH domain-containing protein 11A-like [Anas platyrhynchos]|uniref:zinc finger CCCH domain-containing protein 11A-like n=1 Tax=Anas platyrhynchos TaxID=8839 RepID=UPI003AF21AC3
MKVENSENVPSPTHPPVVINAADDDEDDDGEEPVVRLDLADRQGKRKASADDVSTVPVKRSLAERLGKKVEAPGNADKAPKRDPVQVAKSLKDRLGLPPKQTSTERGKAAKPMGEIHVKTLEEIRREKALQRRETQAKGEAEGHGKTEDSSAGARPARAGRIKTFPEALSENKNNRLVEEKKKAGESPSKSKIQAPEKEEKKAVKLNRPFPTLSSVADVRPTQQSGTRKCPEKSFEESRWEKWQQREQEKLRKEEAAVKSTAGFFNTEPAGKVAAQFQGQEAKTNLMTSAKPSGGKVTFPKKKALKRKAPGSYPSAVAAVELRTAFAADMMGPPAKKAAMGVSDVPEHIPAIRLEENPPNRPEVRLGSPARFEEQMEIDLETSTSASSQLEEARTRQLSSAGNAPLSADEDFEKLLWEISGGRLEAEIDLDPGKDEDDLLLELSEMIDS